jgi:hypothetical protein
MRYVHPHPSSHRSIGSCRRGRIGPPRRVRPLRFPLNSGPEPAGGEAGGHGFFSYTIEDNQFCWTLSWQGIVEPFAGQVHVAPRGVAGPVEIDLNADGVGGPDAEGCRVIDAGLAAAITSDPGAYYVNLHNAGFQAGAIRGQLK